MEFEVRGGGVEDIPRLDLVKPSHILFHLIKYSLISSSAQGGCVHTGKSNIRGCALGWETRFSACAPAFSGDYTCFL